MKFEIEKFRKTSATARELENVIMEEARKTGAAITREQAGNIAAVVRRVHEEQQPKDAASLRDGVIGAFESHSRAKRYEFVGYAEGGDETDRLEHGLNSENTARQKAGRMAIRINGPVDLAIAGTAPWNERYITTANPSEHHAAGYRFERLDS